MLAKSLTDDLAWEVQRQLVNSYFREKQSTPPPQMESVLQTTPPPQLDTTAALIPLLTQLTALIERLSVPQQPQVKCTPPEPKPAERPVVMPVELLER